MRIIVNRSLCQGHARCAAVDPDLFVLDEDGYIAIDEAVVPPGKDDAARDGVAACPELALSIDES